MPARSEAVYTVCPVLLLMHRPSVWNRSVAKTAKFCSIVTAGRTSLSRSARTLALGGACLMMLAASAPAFSQTLPPVTTERLSTSQQSQVREYVETRLQTLETADPSSAEATRARRELIDPMRNRDTSVAMRQAFAEAAQQRLRAMAGSDNDQRAVSALLIAGNIGDRQSVAILEIGLSDEREVVQIGAAAGAKAMLRVIDGRLGGAQADRQSQIQQLLADQLAITRSGHVAQSLIGALTALPENPAFMTVSSGHIASEMARQSTTRRQVQSGQALDNGWAGALERSIAAQLAYLRSVAISGADISRETQSQAAKIAGVALSLVRDRLEELSADEQAAFMTEHARLIRASETLLVLIESNLAARTARQQVMGNLISGEDADGLIDAINTWVGPRGVLTGAPFSFPATDFGN